MWVRSQNKSCLYKFVGFYIRYFESGVFDFFGETIKGEEFSIGEYSTEEKALKVMDMIQKTIIRNETVYAHAFSGSGVRDYDIFQMPADESL